MTVADASDYVVTNLSDTESHTLSMTVPNGELWYLESVVHTADNSNLNQQLETEIRIPASGGTVFSNYKSANPGQTINTDVGMFVTGGMEIWAKGQANSGTGYPFTLYVVARRIL